MRWQKRARLAAAAFGIASAVGVYALMGERTQPTPAAAPVRLDPKAVLESRGNILQQVRGTRQDYVIEADQQLTYENGATKLVGITLTVKDRGGRDYRITADEARAGAKQQELHLAGDVRLEASDGFRIRTAEAEFSETTGTVRAPGAFEFSRGRMSGAGAGMAYDQNADVLTIAEDARVVFAGGEGDDLAFTAGSAVFTRPGHLLELAGAVHVVRGTQVIDANDIRAHLTDDDSLVRMLELRGRAVVSGGAAGLETMTAESIDLHYAADGETLERLELTGMARVAMAGQGAGRQISGQWLEFSLAEDGSPTEVGGREGVRLQLASAAGAPARTVAATALDGTGESGKGLTALRFQENVQFVEGAAADLRRATASSLEIRMDADALRSAVFTGNVRFVQGGLEGSGERAVYEPARDALQLARGSGGTMSRLADDQVTVEAATIDVTLGSRRISASGSVKTTLRAAAGSAPGEPRRQASSRLPGLLKQEQPANVSADQFRYEGAAGTVTYEGNATLVQGDTAVRAATIAIDQDNGNFVATGDARSSMPLDAGRSVGRAARISYDDAMRVITYTGAPAAPAAPAGPARGAGLAQLSGPHGELRAAEIQIVLAPGGGAAERLEASGGVDLTVDTRRVTGSRLTYFGAEDRYLIAGAGITPVRVVERCRTISGRTLIFFRSTDRIIVDGNEEIRTQTTTGGPCAQPPPSAR